MTIKVDGKDETFKYRLLKPAKIEAGKKYPLVLFLHGAGERGDDNKSQLKYFPTWMAEDKNREKFPCYVIAPQCRTGKKWAEVDWSAATSTPMTPEPGSQMKYALAALDETIKNGQVDESRLYLTGLSMGATAAGTWPRVSPSVLPRWCRFAAAATKSKPQSSRNYRFGFGTGMPTRRSRSNARGKWSKRSKPPAARQNIVSCPASATIAGRRLTMGRTTA